MNKSKKPITLDEDEWICPFNHRFRTKTVILDRIYCPKCCRRYTKYHLECIKKKMRKDGKLR